MRRLCCLLLSLFSVFAWADAEKTAWCEQLDRRLKSVEAAFCRSLPFVAGAERSHEGRPLFLLDRPPSLDEAEEKNGKAAPGARIFMIGGVHGDELTSISIVFRWLPWLADAEAKRHHWQIIPLANPDGLFARPSRRTNGKGVDINRNFPTPDWERDAIAYWQRRTGKDPRRYPGDESLSEPETRWLTEAIQAFQPDIIVSIHAPYGILDYDGPRQKPLRFGSLTLNQLGVYPGSLGNFGGIHKNIPVVTLELAHATVMPTRAEQRRIWTDMLAWIARHIEAKEK
ncbi:MAG: succinylglutamate desuccinylase/aspartoacylase family protein [Betaproteobacteria bacterium]|nr:succinylglutamate desuccinylase/aspartoacylase family protein [Betaproteobacteria bacterium]